MLTGPRKRRHLNGDVSFVPMEFNPNDSQLQRSAETVANRNNITSAAISIPANMISPRIQSIDDKTAELNRQMMEKAAQQREEIIRYNQSLMNYLTPEKIEEIKRKHRL